MAIFPFFLTAAIAAAPLPPAAPPSHPQAEARGEDPALWVVNDNDTIIYLFGTFHALDANAHWFEQAAKAAFSESDELMLETVVPRRPGTRAPARKKPKGNLAPAPAPPYGGDGSVAQLAPSASYMATTKLVMNAGRAKGMSTDRGADAVLRDAADEAGMPVGGLESFDFQLRMFSSLPGGPSPVPPRQDARTVQALGAMLASLQAGWSRGEVEETFTPLLRKMQAQSPDTYRTMFTERNVRWAYWIADRLKSPGTVFVAVGAGHLSGPDSVQNKLGALGVKSARIN